MADTISENRIALLHPLIRFEALEAYKKAVKETPTGVHPVIVQTLRTFKQQNDLYAIGRTKPGNKITNAKSGFSFHNYGLALDFALSVKGKIIWEVNEDWMTVINIYKSYGWESGLDWKKFRDAPHLQRTFGFTVKQLLAKYNREEFITSPYVEI